MADELYSMLEDDKVFIDLFNGYRGTLNPVGNKGNPVNNIADALAILTSRKKSTLQILGTGEVVTGSVTSDSGITNVLVDNSHTYAVNALIGMTITNGSDASSGVITANDAHTITAKLAGGTNNYWTNGDIYSIVPGITGACTNAAPSSTVMTDALATFAPGDLVGFRIVNNTKGCNGIIISNTGTTITTAAMTSDWEAADDYVVNALYIDEGATEGPPMLIDAGASFVPNALIGLLVTNDTDVSRGVVTDNTDTTVTLVLAGGTNDYWTSGDNYTIHYDTLVFDSNISLELVGNVGYSLIIEAFTVNLLGDVACNNLRNVGTLVVAGSLDSKGNVDNTGATSFDVKGFCDIIGNFVNDECDTTTGPLTVNGDITNAAAGVITSNGGVLLAGTLTNTGTINNNVYHYP